jgi:Baculovirus FP protein
MTKPCCICNKNVTDKRFPGLSCKECSKVYHIICGDIKKSTFESITTDRTLSWTCKICKQKPSHRRSGIFPAVTASESNSGAVVVHKTSRPSLQLPTSQSQTEKQLQDVLASLNNLTAAFADYKATTDARIAQLEACLTTRSEEVISLVNSVEKVTSKTEELEQLQSETLLTIQGIPESRLANPVDAALEVAQKIGCTITTADIDCFVSAAGEKPIVVVKFSSKAIRTSFLHAGKKFNREKKRLIVNGAPNKIFVNEFMTAAQKKLLYNTKCFARANNFDYTWFCNNRVHLKKTNYSQLLIISSQLHLDDLAANVSVNDSIRISEANVSVPERQRVANEDQRVAASHQH